MGAVAVICSMRVRYKNIKEERNHRVSYESEDFPEFPCKKGSVCNHVTIYITYRIIIMDYIQNYYSCVEKVINKKALL